MYNRNRKRLAEHVLDGKPLGQALSYPPIEQIQECYTNIFGTETPSDDRLIIDHKEKVVYTFLPITDYKIN